MNDMNPNWFLAAAALLAVAACTVLSWRLYLSRRAVRDFLEATSEFKRSLELLAPAEPGSRRAPIVADGALLDAVRSQADTLVALKDDSHKLHVLAEELSDFLVVADRQGQVLAANQELLRVLGTTAARLKDMHLQELLVQGARQPAAGQKESNERAGSRFDATLRRPEGDDMPVTGRSGFVRLSTGPVVIYSFRDRTDEFRAQRTLEAALSEAQRSGDLRAQFLANMSHEIRTPLNGLLGMVDLLEDSTLTAEQHERVRLLKSSARRLMTLLVDILDFSKIEAGHMAIESITFDLPAKVEQCFKLFEPLAQSKGIDLRFVTRLQHIYITSDPNRLLQVVSNLMDNALKFTRSGSVVLRVETSTDPDDEDYCHTLIVVQDTGVGIDASALPKLFTPFMQSDESISRKYGGTGLGLALCRQLVELMGGTIGVESTIGVGSTFTVRIRSLVGVADRFEDTAPADPLEEAREDVLAGRSVLLVDDNEVNQALVATWLKKRGVKVTLASDGESGIRQAMKEQFDAILMDVWLARPSGIDATKLLRATSLTNPQRYGYLRRVPILGVTAYAMQSDRDACLAAGMNDHMSKPLSQQILISRLASLIERGLHQATR
jgi:PAS domain S-box-containing protein